MISLRPIRLAAAAGYLACAAAAHAQTTPPPEAKSAAQSAARGYSVVLVLGDAQSGNADTVPPAARKALADLKDFLPYRGYRLLDAQWILGSQRSVSRLRGPDDQDYQLTLRTAPQGGRVYVTFHLQEADAVGMTALPRSGDGPGARGREPGEMRRGPGEMWPRVAVSTRSVIDTAFTMAVGETVVVGTSRVRGDKALIALLTAVAKGK